MSSFLNQSQINSLTGIFQNHFETFASGSNNYIYVVKEAIKVFSNTTDNSIPGYSYDTVNIQDVSYQPVTGVFPAMIIYPKTLQSNQFAQLKFSLDEDQVMIKIEPKTKDFLLSGKTERIIIDDQDFNMATTFTVQSYFGSRYYYFKLTSTK